MRCGKTVENPEEEYCGDCVAIPKHFVRGFPVFSYEEPVKSALYDFKYKNQRNYAGFFADCIYQYYGEHLQKIKLEGLVPVPVHPHKKRSRGYNQAELLAVELGKRLGLPAYGDYLLREVDTNPQKELGDKARMKNIKNAFKISPNAIKLKKILLVDDIYTSGATVDACTCALQEFGVDEVYYTSVAIGKGY
jgi:ComF family protein